MNDSDVRIVAKHAVESFIRWQVADGVFPEPEFDDMLEAMGALGYALGIDMVELHNEWRQRYDSLPH